MKRKNIIFTTMLMMLILSACSSDAGKETGGNDVQSAEDYDMAGENQSPERQEQPEESRNQSTEIPQPSEGVEQTKETEPSEVGLDDIDEELEKGEEDQSDKKAQTWQEAYLEIIYHLQDYLVPIYEPDGTNSRRYDDPMNLQIYLGLHDFDADGTVELIAGDLWSLAVFTYQDGQAEKIADLYNPYAAWCINGVDFKENSVSAGCSGSGGTDWVSFGFLNGEYVLGVYNEICPDYGITINGEKGTWEEMNEIYTLDYDQREEEEDRERIRLVNENGIWMLKYQSGEEAVLDINFDFDTILW